jgi:hypothetical protein
MHRLIKSELKINLHDCKFYKILHVYQNVKILQPTLEQYHVHSQTVLLGPSFPYFGGKSSVPFPSLVNTYFSPI